MSKTIFKNTVSKVLLNLFNIVVPILTGPYVARKLGPEMLGTVNYTTSVYAYFLIFANFGVYQYGVREVSRVRDDKDKVNKLFTSLFVITTFTTLVTFIVYLAYAVSLKNTDYTLYIISMIMSFNFLANIIYIEWTNEGFENYGFITKKTIIIRLIYVLFLFILVKSAKDYKQYVFLQVLSALANNIISYIYIKKTVKFDFINLAIKKHIKPMFLVVILSNSNMLYTQLDKLMLGNYINKTSVGFYTMAQNIMTIVSTLMLSIIQVTIPRLSNLSKKDDEGYTGLLNKTSKIYFMVVIPVAVGMFILSKNIILLYGGNQYIGTEVTLRVFAVYMLTLGCESILANQVMYIKNKEKRQVSFIFICGFINLVTKVILLMACIFNATSAILTTMISNIILIIMEYTYTRRVLKIRVEIFNFEILSYLLIALLFIPVNLVTGRLVSNIIIETGLIFVIDAVMYGLILYILKDETFINTYGMIKSKFLNRIKK